MKKKALVFFSHLKFRDIELDLVKYIKKKQNYRTIFVVNTIQTKLFYQKKFPNSVDEIVVYEDEFDLINKKIDKKNLFDKALRIEEDLGVSLNRAFLLERTIGRGFHASGGFNHPKTRLSESSQIDILKIAVGLVDFWFRLFKKYDIKLAINLPQIGTRIAKLEGINTKTLVIGKFGKRLYWSNLINFEPDTLIKFYNENKKKKFKRFVPDKPQFNHMALRNEDIRGFKFLDTFNASSIMLFRRLYGYLRGYRKSRNIHAFSEYKYFWRKRRDFFRHRRQSDINFKELKNLNYKYIYFPLMTEPESSLHGMADDFFFQLSAINMLARDLPANYKIIVKEHLIALGRRPKDFYDQIKELKCVLFADPLDFGINYMKKAEAVALIAGTSGWEASAMGIPVITFTKYNAYNFLDHVFTVTHPDDTWSIIDHLKKNTYPSKKSIHDGAKMYDSYLKMSFKFEKNSPFIKWDFNSNEKITEKFIKNIYLRLNMF